MNSIQYLGHSCFLLTLGGKHIVVDPFIRSNALTEGLVEVDEIKADFVLLSHGHSDHVEDAEELSLRNGAPIIANFEVAAWFEDKGCQTHGMNLGGHKDFGFGDVRLVSAVHSSTMPDGSDGGNPGGFLIKNGPDTIYISGDTALSKDMELIPAFYGKPTISIFPVGGFFTMDYKDALNAADLVQCGLVVGCHFNTFPPISIHKEEAVQYFSDHGKTLILPEINQIINL